MRRRFGADYLRDEVDGLGAALPEPTGAYLIGGGSMAFRDLKDATKDIDLVVENRTTLDRIRDRSPAARTRRCDPRRANTSHSARRS